MTSTHNASGRPAARSKKRERARTPRAPAGDFAPCTPISEWISEKEYHIYALKDTKWYYVVKRRLAGRSHDDRTLNLEVIYDIQHPPVGSRQGWDAP